LQRGSKKGRERIKKETNGIKGDAAKISVTKTTSPEFWFSMF
jgi:hypothetical protein